MFLLGLTLGALAGGVGVGVVAHRKPAWFNKGVTLVNALDDKINATAGPAVAKAGGAIADAVKGAPPAPKA